MRLCAYSFYCHSDKCHMFFDSFNIHKVQWGLLCCICLLYVTHYGVGMLLHVQIHHTRCKSVVSRGVLISNKFSRDMYVLVWQLWWHSLMSSATLVGHIRSCLCHLTFVMAVCPCENNQTICHLEIYHWRIYLLIWIFSVFSFINLSHVWCGQVFAAVC